MNCSQAALVISRQLTATEHSQLYAELVNRKWASKPYTSGSTKRNYAPELIVDGNMEAAGTAAWLSGTATLTKETGNVLAGKQVLRIAYNASGIGYAGQAVCVPGKRYRITGWVRSDGGAIPRIGENPTFVWVGTASTTWQYFDVIASFVYGQPRFYSYPVAAGQYTEWDKISCKEISVNPVEFKLGNIPHQTTGVISAHFPFSGIVSTYITVAGAEGPSAQMFLGTSSSGTRVFLPTRVGKQSPSQMAYGTWEFWLWKGNTGNQNYYFLDRNTLTGANGYQINFSSTETLTLSRVTNGTADLTIMAGLLAIAPAAWVKIRITRNPLDGQFTIYVNNVLMSVVGGSGTNPATENTYKSFSHYLLSIPSGCYSAISDIEGNHSFWKAQGVIVP
jgi:hypothetical protein